MYRLSMAVFFLFSFDASPQSNRPIKAFAGVPPVAYLVERIGGDRVSVQSLLKPGDNPHTFEPRPRDIIEIHHADLYFSVGLPFERRITQKLEKLKLVRTEEGIPSQSGVRSESTRGIHPSDDILEDDPHIWLSPPLIRIQAKNILAGFEALDPSAAPFYQNNYKRLLNDLDVLDQWIVHQFKSYPGRTFLVFHSAFGRFADWAGLRQISIENEGRSPSPRELSAVIAIAKHEKIRTVFVEPQFEGRSAGAVAEAIGGRMERLDPMGTNLIENMKTITEKIAQSFSESDKRPGDQNR